MMYSNTSSLGGMGLSVGRSSVPKERTVEKKKKIAVHNYVKTFGKARIYTIKLHQTTYTRNATLLTSI